MSFHVIRGLPQAANRTVEFEGGEYSSPVSIILVDSDPGRGPGLHTHPYAETWIVRGGRALMTIGGETIEAGPGDAVVVEAGTPHGFTNPGPERLQIVCVHASGSFTTEWL